MRKGRLKAVTVSVPLTCSGTSTAPCTTTLVAKHGRDTLLKRTVTVPRGRRTTVVLTLPARSTTAVSRLVRKKTYVVALTVGDKGWASRARSLTIRR